jgi:hypothetical protein
MLSPTGPTFNVDATITGTLCITQTISIGHRVHPFICVDIAVRRRKWRSGVGEATPAAQCEFQSLYFAHTNIAQCFQTQAVLRNVLTSLILLLSLFNPLQVITSVACLVGAASPNAAQHDPTKKQTLRWAARFSVLSRAIPREVRSDGTPTHVLPTRAVVLGWHEYMIIWLKMCEMCEASCSRLECY